MVGPLQLIVTMIHHRPQLPIFNFNFFTKTVHLYVASAALIHCLVYKYRKLDLLCCSTERNFKHVTRLAPFHPPKITLGDN
jgi:hypothetical protein